jgi:hypothetical protein
LLHVRRLLDRPPDSAVARLWPPVAIGAGAASAAPLTGLSFAACAGNTVQGLALTVPVVV